MRELMISCASCFLGGNTPYRSPAVASLNIDIESDTEENDKVIEDNEFIPTTQRSANESNYAIESQSTPTSRRSSGSGGSLKSNSSPSDSTTPGSLTRTSSFHQKYLEATKSPSPTKIATRMSPRAAPAPMVAALKVPVKNAVAEQQAVIDKETEIANLRTSAKWSRAGRKEFSESPTIVATTATASSVIESKSPESADQNDQSIIRSRVFFPEETEIDTSTTTTTTTTPVQSISNAIKVTQQTTAPASTTTPLREPKSLTGGTVTPTPKSTGMSTPTVAPNSAIVRKRVSGSVKMLSALAKYQGKFNFKALCKGFFRWTELINESQLASESPQPGGGEGSSSIYTVIQYNLYSIYLLSIIVYHIVYLYLYNLLDKLLMDSEEPELSDNAFSYAGNYGNGQFATSLTYLCSFYER